MFGMRIERLHIVNWYIYYIHQTVFEIVPIVLINRLWLSQQDWQLNFCILLDQSCSVNQFMAFELLDVFSLLHLPVISIKLHLKQFLCFNKQVIAQSRGLATQFLDSLRPLLFSESVYSIRVIKCIFLYYLYQLYPSNCISNSSYCFNEQVRAQSRGFTTQFLYSLRSVMFNEEVYGI